MKFDNFFRQEKFKYFPVLVILFTVIVVWLWVFGFPLSPPRNIENLLETSPREIPSFEKKITVPSIVENKVLGLGGVILEIDYQKEILLLKPLFHEKDPFGKDLPEKIRINLEKEVKILTTLKEGESFSKKEISLSELKVGDKIYITSKEDIRDKDGKIKTEISANQIKKI